MKLYRILTHEVLIVGDLSLLYKKLLIFFFSLVPISWDLFYGSVTWKQWRIYFENKWRIDALTNGGGHSKWNAACKQMGLCYRWVKRTRRSSPHLSFPNGACAHRSRITTLFFSWMKCNKFFTLPLGELNSCLPQLAFVLVAEMIWNTCIVPKSTLLSSRMFCWSRWDEVMQLIK